MLLIRTTSPSLSLQNPTIFSGSVRENLDPNNEYSDEDIWSALEKARLKRFICRSGSGLETSLANTGEKPSVILRFVSFTHHGYFFKDSLLVIANSRLQFYSPVQTMNLLNTLGIFLTPGNRLFKNFKVF